MNVVIWQKSISNLHTLTPSCISRCPIEMILSDLKKSGLHIFGRLCSWIILRVCEPTWSLFGWVFLLSNRVIWYFLPYQTESRVCNSSNFLFNTHITPVKCIWNFWNDDNTNNWRKVMEKFSYMLKYDTEKKSNKGFYKKILYWNIGQETWKKNLIRLAWWDLYESADLAILSKNYYVTSLA